MLSFIAGSDVSLGMADRIAGTLQITRVDLESAAQLARAPSPAGRRYVFVGMGVGVDVEPGLIDVTDRIILYRIVCVCATGQTSRACSCRCGRRASGSSSRRCVRAEDAAIDPCTG